MNKSHKHRPVKIDFAPLSFGGWHDYELWASHGFTPKPNPVDSDTSPPPDPATTEAPDEPGPDDQPPTADQQAVSESPAPIWPTEESPAVEPLGERSTPVPRPYVRTGGRTRVRHELRLETMISATGRHTRAGVAGELDQECLVICRLCRTPTSVAEIAALIKAPIGVARVLIGDAIDARLLRTQRVDLELNDRPSMELMQRVYRGLVKLS
jgi:hypothetical protein